ncbi:sensor histidine kinase [Aquabacterium sp.]|uniref:sensor histidine kinase n=1 Tax=Aquabacterium sp. TaxID=1872578 RepID=UPI002C854AD8|nr:ATP-binding protein [Aquabacterium sp.]HSW08379.1 ATP-binding protein [Aquabacterium sp.]
MTQDAQARLLIVDDEAAQMRALCETLQDQGYQTCGFTDARAALTALHQQGADLLLADLAMPEMDGITLLREALRIDPQLVGVIMTGEGTISTAVEAMRSGAHDYILKPFRMSAILPVLQRALAMRSLRVENARLAQRLHEHALELEASNRELDAFTRSASHDLRSPLNGLLGLSTLLSRRFSAQLPEQAGRWLRQIESEARRMSRLLDDLMRLSRLGRQALELQAVAVDALVRGVVDELRLREPQRRIDVRIEPLPQATADAALLRQVFVNLLSNAFKFTRDSTPAEVVIGCDHEGGEAVFRVRDNGAGFDMARADKLFSAFERLHRPEDFEGSGVGLSIVQRIVQRHGGRIWAQAAPGEGACFRFTLVAAQHGASVRSDPPPA